MLELITFLVILLFASIFLILFSAFIEIIFAIIATFITSFISYVWYIIPLGIAILILVQIFEFSQKKDDFK